MTTTNGLQFSAESVYGSDWSSYRHRLIVDGVRLQLSVSGFSSESFGHLSQPPKRPLRAFLHVERQRFRQMRKERRTFGKACRDSRAHENQSKQLLLSWKSNVVDLHLCFRLPVLYLSPDLAARLSHELISDL